MKSAKLRRGRNLAEPGSGLNVRSALIACGFLLPITQIAFFARQNSFANQSSADHDHDQCQDESYSAAFVLLLPILEKPRAARFTVRRPGVSGVGISTPHPSCSQSASLLRGREVRTQETPQLQLYTYKVAHVRGRQGVPLSDCAHVHDLRVAYPEFAPLAAREPGLAGVFCSQT